jgi:glucose/arabinose dehydrogenase
MNAGFQFGKAAAGLAAACLGLSILASAPALGATLPAGFQDSVVFSNLEQPTALRFAADGRVFVAEKPGKILVFDSLADETPEVFADIRTQVYDTGDRGILGLALDPEFTEGRPYVYVLYTYDHLLGDPQPAPKWGEAEHTGDDCPKPEDADVDACPVSGRLVRLTADEGGAGDHAVEEGGAPLEKVLLEDWCQQFSSHSIGDIQFDASGALYASGGDGASFNNADYGQFGWPEKNQCGDPPAGIGGTMSPPTAEGGALRSQDARTPANPLDPTADPTDLNGSIVRIDPDTGEGLPDNPMHSSFDANERRIVGYGFRNPFRFAIDPETDELYVDNVGWALYEEMDRFSPDSTPTFNSGWPCYEGPEFAYGSLGLDLCEGLYHEPGSTAPPFFFYNHIEPVTPEDPCFNPAEPEGEGSAISGIAFYEGSAFPPSYHGALFFADAVRGCAYVMFPGEDGRPDPSTAVPFMSDAGLYPGVDLEEGPEGDLYYVNLYGEGFGPGSIHRIEYFSGNKPPVARLTADNEWGPSPLQTEFDAGGSSDADGDPLEYEWDTNEDGVYTAPAPDDTTKITNWEDEANHTIAVRVTDSHGAQSTARLTVYPGDTPPEVDVLSPAPSLEWHVGQQIHFEGSATDEQSGDLPSTRLDWSSRLLHCPSACHRHPLQAFPSVASGTLIAPDHDYPSSIELTLTAADSRGLTASKTIQLQAHPVALTLKSKPPGLTLSAGLLTKVTPFTLTAIEDSKVTLAAPATAELAGTVYPWLGWSDGGARVHTVQAAGPATYVADYGGEEEAATKEEAAKGPPAESPPPIVGPPPPSPQPSPQTRLGTHPPSRGSGTTAKFTFSSSQPGASFKCKLDRKPFRSCRSPKVYKHLKPGDHAFRVIAIGPEGRADPTPSVFRWKVLD